MGIYCYFINFLFNNFVKLNLKIVPFCYFQNMFPFVSMSRQTADIGKKSPKLFVAQGIGIPLLTVLTVLRLNKIN